MTLPGPDPTSHTPAHGAPNSDGDGDRTALAVTRDLRKGYGPDQVLRGVSLRIHRGELVGLMGRSGSGKSTLLHVLGGLDREFSGSVRLFGQELAQLSDGALSLLRNARIGFVFQSFHLLDHVSCVDNVLLPNAFAKDPLPRRQAIEKAREALSRVGLADRAWARPSELSGGQKQRVAIARALLFSPELLLCDEPTGNLDAHTGQQIIELFARLHQDGLTLLLVTHELRVAQAAQRILRLADGQLVAGSAADALPEGGGPEPGPGPGPGNDRPQAETAP
jgi:putative ABC transport system ATP-binding protein